LSLYATKVSKSQITDVAKSQLYVVNIGVLHLPYL
jgi:hypothetical protein